MRSRKFLTVIIFILWTGVSSLAQAGENIYGNNPEVGKSVEINGIQFYYEIYGEGEPLVLIHGSGDSIAGMAAQISYFSKNHMVIVADSRGHGKSGLGTGDLTYIQMMEDWNELLSRLNVENANIFGWSDGGIIGLLMAIHHPEKINKLAVMGANLRPDNSAVQAWVRPILAEANKHVDEMIAKKDASLNWKAQKQMLNLLETQPNIELAALQKVTTPVLVMAGDRDVIREEHTIEIFQNLQNSQLAILPGNTHFAPVADPDRFNLLLNDFFSRPFSMPTTEDFMKQQ